MRGDTYILILLLLLAPTLATELHTTTYTAGDTFTLETHTFTIITPYDGFVNIAMDGAGRILKQDDCINTPRHYFCVTDSDNTSTTLTFHAHDYTISLARTIPSTVIVGDTYVVELRLTSTAPFPLPVTLVETTDAHVTNPRDFPEGLRWEGTLSPQGTQRLRYTVHADRAGTVTFHANATSEWNATHRATVTARDGITVSITYENDTTIGVTHNLSITITNPQSPMNITVHLDVPEGVTILQTRNLTHRDGTLRNVDEVNTSKTYWATYTHTSTHTAANITVRTVNGTHDVTRRYPFTLHRSRLKPLILIHGHTMKHIPPRTTTDLPFQIHNPNPFRIDATWEATSTLVEDRASVTLPANGTQTRTLSVTPNATDSHYSIGITVTYRDENGNDVTQRWDIPLIARHTEQIPPPEPEPELTTEPVQEPRLQAAADANTIHLSVTHLALTEATLTITHNDQPFVTQNITLINATTISRETQGPGAYRITLTTPEHTLQTTVTIPEPTPEPEPEQEPTNAPPWTWLWLIIPGALLLLTVTPVRAALLERRIIAREAQLEKDEAVVNTFIPASSRDLLLQQELVGALERQKTDLRRLRRTLGTLRKRKQ